jgi:hypothetical protein
MNDILLSRLTGSAAVVGGLAVCAASYVDSTLPIGCVGDQCNYRPERPSSVSVNVLDLVAFVLLVASVAGLGLLVRRRRRLGRMLVTGVGLVVIGAVVAVVANVVQAVFFDGDLAVMPAIFLPAIAAMVLGLALLMVTAIRARVVPLWAGVVVALTLLLIPFGNQENTSVLLDIPFGLAWTLAGLLLVRRSGREATPLRNPGVGAHVEGA